MAKAKTGSEIVAKSQAKNLKAGGDRITLNLSPDEAKEWHALLERYPWRGGQKEAFMDAIRALLQSNGGPRLSKEQLMQEIKRRLS